MPNSLLNRQRCGLQLPRQRLFLKTYVKTTSDSIKICFKAYFSSRFICRYRKSPYLCTVFFMVLDLRLTKVGLSGALFLCPYVSCFRRQVAFGGRIVYTLALHSLYLGTPFLIPWEYVSYTLSSRAFCKRGLGGCSMQGNGRISTVDGNGWNACLLREVLVSVSFLLGIFFRCTEERSGLRDEVCREKRPERGSKEAEYKSKRGKFKQALSRVREKFVLALSSV